MTNKSLLIIFVILFSLSLCFPGISYIDDTSDTLSIYYGYEILLYGWAGFLFGMFAWYGNMMIIFSLVWIRSKRYRGAMWSAITGFIIGLQAFWLKALPSNIGDNNDVVSSLDASYYIWMLSICVLAFYSYQLYKSDSNSSASQSN